jgi:hypothetical protein
LPFFERISFPINFNGLFGKIDFVCILLKLFHESFELINEFGITIKEFNFFLNSVMIAQLFECTMLFDFLEKLKEDMDIGYFFAENDVVFGVAK